MLSKLNENNNNTWIFLYDGCIMMNQSFGVFQHRHNRALRHLIRNAEKSNTERKVRKNIIVTQQTNRRLVKKSIFLVAREYYLDGEGELYERTTTTRFDLVKDLIRWHKNLHKS